MSRIEKFRARVEATFGGGHLVLIPITVARALGLKPRTRVRGRVAGVDHRSSLMRRQGEFYLGIHKATLAEAGVDTGALVDVELAVDLEPLPNDTVPPALQRALDANARAKTAWSALAPSHRREHVGYVNEAKKEETRAARVERTIASLLLAPKKKK